MLHNLYVTLTVVFPFLFYLSFGMFLRKIGALPDDFSGRLNRFIARVLLPVYMFNSIYNKDIGRAFREPVALYVGLGTLAIMLLMMAVIPFFEKDPAKQGALVHCSARSNAIVFALPIAQGIFGEDIPEIVVVLAIVGLVNNLEAVPMMEYYRNKVRAAQGEETEKVRISVKALALDCLKTPLLDAVIIGIVWSLLKIPMPEMAGTAVKGLGGTVVPLAFIVLGARLDFGHLKSNRRSVILVSLVKLFAVPALFLILPLILGWSERNLVAVMVAFGAPTAVTAYAMTEAYECDGKMAGEIVSLTSFLSIFSIFLWIFTFKQLGLIS